jgi:hypothetical protein
VTLKFAVCPAVTVRFAGCEVIDGATALAVTVRAAELLVRLPLLSVTTTVNWVPLSGFVVAGVVYEAAIAPPMAVPFFFH